MGSDPFSVPGFTRLVPSVVFGVALVLSMIGLAHALRTVPSAPAAAWFAMALRGPLIAYRREFVGPRALHPRRGGARGGHIDRGVRTTYGVGAAGFEPATARV